jgi:hypothetical protein
MAKDVCSAAVRYHVACVGGCGALHPWPDLSLLAAAAPRSRYGVVRGAMSPIRTKAVIEW